VPNSDALQADAGSTSHDLITAKRLLRRKVDKNARPHFNRRIAYPEGVA
jgi:hypothetical protein